MTTTPALSAPASGWRDGWDTRLPGLWALYNAIAYAIVLLTVSGLNSLSARRLGRRLLLMRGIAEIFTAFRLPGLAKEQQTA